jgi:hypothetical protein
MRVLVMIPVAAVAVGLGLAAAQVMSPSEKAAKSSYVFDGTVKALNQSNVKDVPASERTIVVTVDKVSKGNEVGHGTAGQEVTVVLDKPLGEQPYKVGDRATFFTECVAASDHIAVQEVAPAEKAAPAPGKGAAKASPKLLTPAGGQVAEAVKDESDAELSDLLDQAKTVVHGKVVRVSRVDSADLARPGPPGKVKRRPVREHAADWHRADVDVVSVEKGPRASRVTIYFANSKDFAFKDSPKLAANQEGTFILPDDQPGAAPVRPLIKAAAADPNRAKAYVALHRGSYLPNVAGQENLDRVRRLLGK